MNLYKPVLYVQGKILNLYKPVLYVQGKILKHQGDLIGAVEQVEKAFSLDPGDKYLGNFNLF